MNSPPPVLVRKAEIHDVEQICQVHLRSVRSLCVADYTPEQLEAWVGQCSAENHRYALATLKEITFVAAQASRIIGFASLSAAADKLLGLYVDPDYSGQGVGTRLLLAAEQAAIARQIRTLALSASTTALPFYLARGYCIVAYTSHRLASGIQLPCIKMNKTLQ